MNKLGRFNFSHLVTLVDRHLSTIFVKSGYLGIETCFMRTRVCYHSYLLTYIFFLNFQLFRVWYLILCTIAKMLRSVKDSDEDIESKTSTYYTVCISVYIYIIYPHVAHAGNNYCNGRLASENLSFAVSSSWISWKHRKTILPPLCLV